MEGRKAWIPWIFWILEKRDAYGEAAQPHMALPEPFCLEYYTYV
jgi:hypothetical protein